MSQRPTILLSVPNGGSAGTIVRTGLLGRLLDAHPDTSIVLASSLVRDEAFVREIAHPRIQCEYLEPHEPSRLEERLNGLVQAAYLSSGATESVRIRLAEAQSKGLIRWTRLKRGVVRVALSSMDRKESRYRVTDGLVSHDAAELLFAKYQPALYVASSPGLIAPEIPLLRTAVRRRVRSMAIDPSWDNFTNKLMPVRHVDRLVVWNDLMKQQAINLHGYAPDQVRVAGVPQWDIYFRQGAGTCRDAFCRSIGADPSRKLVTLTTTPRTIYKHHDHVVRVLIAAMQSRAWPYPVHLLVRIHPRDEEVSYAAFRGLPNVTVEKPFRPAAVPSGDGLTVDMTEENRRHLASTMQHSDVIINVASTITIEASIFDTPVVNIAFDGEAPVRWTESAERYYRFTHYQDIGKHSAVRVVGSPAALIDAVGAYLTDPSLDREGRARVVEEQCQFTDGRSAERVAGFVMEELSDVCGSRDSSGST